MTKDQVRQRFEIFMRTVSAGQLDEAIEREAEFIASRFKAVEFEARCAMVAAGIFVALIVGAVFW